MRAFYPSTTDCSSLQGLANDLVLKDDDSQAHEILRDYSTSSPKVLIKEPWGQPLINGTLGL